MCGRTRSETGKNKPLECPSDLSKKADKYSKNMFFIMPIFYLFADWNWRSMLLLWMES